jgi:hypothetical protein
MEQTLTTKLQEFALSCEGRQEACYRRADEADAMAAELERVSTVKGMGRQKRAEAQEHRDSAQKWAERGEQARAGFFLIGDDVKSDPKFMREYQSLMAQAAKEKRVRWGTKPPRSEA